MKVHLLFIFFNKPRVVKKVTEKVLALNLQGVMRFLLNKLNSHGVLEIALD